MSEATESTLKATLPPPAVPARPHARRKRLLVAFMLLQMALWPIIELFAGETWGISYLLHLGVAITIYFWCRFDAADVGKIIPWLTSVALIVVPGIGFPIYMVRVRRAPMGEAISLTFVWSLLFVGISFGAAYLFFVLWFGLS